MIAPPNTLRTDDQIVGLLPPGRGGHRRRRAVLVIQDYPLTFSVQRTPGVIRRIVQELPSCRMLKHEDWPGLEKILDAARLRERRLDAPYLHPLRQQRPVPRQEMERGADGANTGYCFPDMLCDVVRLSAAGQREAAHDLFDAHLPLLRYEQQPGAGLAVRKYVMMRRGLLTSAAQRKPAAAMTPTARSEVDHLLARLARHDPRGGDARLKPAFPRFSGLVLSLSRIDW